MMLGGNPTRGVGPGQAAVLGAQHAAVGAVDGAEEDAALFGEGHGGGVDRDARRRGPGLAGVAGQADADALAAVGLQADDQRAVVHQQGARAADRGGALAGELPGGAEVGGAVDALAEADEEVVLGGDDGEDLVVHGHGGGDLGPVDAVVGRAEEAVGDAGEVMPASSAPSRGVMARM